MSRIHLLEVVDRGDYIRKKILLRTSPHMLMPVYVLIPKRTPRPLLAFVTGHSPSGSAIVVDYV